MHMSMSLGGWSVLGVASAIAIVVGVVLLIVYAVDRQLDRRELDGVIAEAGATTVTAPSPRHGVRLIGVIGGVVLLVGLAAGLLVAMGTWGNPLTGGTTAPGAAPVDCAQSWSGCPQVTPRS
jgi:hypothetical protein